MTTSIVIPTRNRPESFARALDSALAQTADCEIVVVDASDDDRTRDVVRSRAGASTVVYQRLVRDAGFVHAWSLALALARGERVHIQPDDDTIHPSFVERCIEEIDDDVGVVLTQSVTPDGRANLPMMPDVSTRVSSLAVIDLMRKMPLTITPACALLDTETARRHMHSGMIPGTWDVTPCADAYMMMSCIISRPHVAWIAEPLANLGAVADGFTICGLSDPHSAARLGAQYAMVKAAWLSLAGARCV